MSLTPSPSNRVANTEHPPTEFARSPHWSKVEHQQLKDFPTCAACGKTDKQAPLQVHHIYPFHYCIDEVVGRPDLELDPRNLLTLCQSEKGKDADNHHLLLGHLGDFQSYNPNVKTDVTTYKNKTKDQIKADSDWKNRHLARPKDLKDMTDAEKLAMRSILNKLYPPDKTLAALVNATPRTP